MTKTQERKLKTALKRLEKCGGDCHHCEKCRIYTRSTERALYMAVGCDLLPEEMFSCIADSVYVTAQNEEDIRKELAAVEGCSPADLVLYVFEGYTRIPQYKAV